MAKKKKVRESSVSPIIEEMSDVMAEMFEEINAEYIDKMSKHIADIGKLTPTDIHILEQFNRMDSNIEYINKRLAAAAKTTQYRIQKIYQAVGLDNYIQAAPFYAASGKKQVPFSQNKYMQNYISSVSALTNNTFKNLSNTTVMSKNYRKCVDKAIYAISSGVTDYKSYMRKTVNDTVKEGLSVEYASGRRRRLDSAVRMNVLDGVRQVNNEIKKATGEEFGADGVEISAHGLCAPDHIHIQGKRMTNKRFEIVNGNLKRPIGELNCRHSYRPVIMGISVKTYSDEELKEINAYSNETFIIDGKEVTRYQASQMMRNIETQMRYAKEELKAADNLKSPGLKKRAKNKINRLNKKYDTVTRKAGLQPRRDRMYVSTSKDYVKKLETKYRTLAKKLDKQLEIELAKAKEAAKAATKAKELKAAKTAAKTTKKAKAAGTRISTQVKSIDETATMKNYAEYVKSNKTKYKMKWENGYIDSSPVYETELDEIINPAFQKIADEGVCCSRVKTDSLIDILEDGRFKAQFEAGHSEGMYSPAARKNASKNMFGWKKEPANNEFEIYGYLGTSDVKKDFLYDWDVSGYGNIIVHFKNDIKKRTTMTFGDSLDDAMHGSVIPTPMQDVDMTTAVSCFGENVTEFSQKVLAGEYDDPLAKMAKMNDVDYTELQIHGGVSVADIDDICIPESDWEYVISTDKKNRIKELCKLHNIPLKIIKTNR